MDEYLSQSLGSFMRTWVTVRSDGCDPMRVESGWVVQCARAARAYRAQSVVPPRQYRLDLSIHTQLTSRRIIHPGNSFCALKTPDWTDSSDSLDHREQ
jgi:hypothetical protein